MIPQLQKNDVLKIRDVLEAILKWQDGSVTSSDLAQWSQKCSQKWEDEEISIENEDFILHVLYQLSFADWMDSVIPERVEREEDFSLSQEEIKKLIDELQLQLSLKSS